MKKLEEYVRSIPDFPEPGIIFRDVTSILQDADGLKLAVDSMQALLEDVDAEVKKQVKFVPVDYIEEVVNLALVPTVSKKAAENRVN